MSNFMKIHPMGAELFYAEGQTERQAGRRTDTKKLTVALGNSAKAPKKKERNVMGCGTRRQAHCRLFTDDAFELLTTYSKQQAASKHCKPFTDRFGLISQNISIFMKSAAEDHKRRNKLAMFCPH